MRADVFVGQEMHCLWSRGKGKASNYFLCLVRRWIQIRCSAEVGVEIQTMA